MTAPAVDKRENERNHKVHGRGQSPTGEKFRGGKLPAGKDEKNAGQQGADENVLSVRLRIPDRQYDGPNAVSREISEAR